MIFIRRSLAGLQEGNYSDQYASQSEHDKDLNHGLFCCSAEYCSPQQLSLGQHFQCYQIRKIAGVKTSLFFGEKHRTTFVPVYCLEIEITL